MRTKYKLETLEPIVKNSISYAEVLRKLGYKQAGGMQAYIKKLIEHFQLSVKHFKGQSSGKGKLLLSDDEVFEETGKRQRPLVKKYFLKHVEYECAKCEIGSWNGEDLILELHHKNGKNSDNRFKNLELLCPNCHSLTPQFKMRRN